MLRYWSNIFAMLGVALIATAFSALIGRPELCPGESLSCSGHGRMAYPCLPKEGKNEPLLLCYDCRNYRLRRAFCSAPQGQTSLSPPCPP